MLAAAALSLLVTIGPSLIAIPDEPGAEVIVEASIYQAVVADLDGDGAREIVAMTHGDGSVIAASAWRQDGGTWGRVGQPLEVVPGATVPGVAWLGTPLRLLVRSVEGEDRVTLVRQPLYRNPDEGPRCCLLLDDLVLDAGGLRMVPASPTHASADAIHVIDLDADGTDELVTTTSVLPLGDISFPTDVRIHRWSGDGFDITESRLELGSGDTPFVLGDSDGRPGDELGLIASAGRPALYRLSLADDEDVLVAEDAGIVADGAMAVPLGADARGIAVLTGGALSVHAWPAGQPLGPPSAGLPMDEATFLGMVALDGTDSVLVRQTLGGDRVHAFGLPALAPPRFGAITRSAAAAAFASGPVTPYVGPLPGGGPDEQPAVVYAGRLLATGSPAPLDPVTGLRFATMAGSQPIGLVGEDRSQLALLHGATRPPVDEHGGRLEAPILNVPAAVSVAPLELALEAEAEDAVLEPPVDGAVPLGARNSIAVGPDGFTATVAAPAGSRVYVASEDPSVVEATLVVPETGSLDVPIAPTGVTTPNPRYRASLGVTTPAGHSYLATWEVRVLDGPPPLEVTVATQLGSGAVEVSGQSASYATVTVDGEAVTVDADGGFAARRALPPWPTDVDVAASDPFGNVTERAVSGIGWFDYRGLPWIPIVVVGVAAAAVVLFLRVPRTTPEPRRADDDSALEELEAD
jgi:hypothetical protein